MEIPNDCKEMTEKYKIDKGGICGQSCLAVIENPTIKQVLENWKKLGLEWKGYSGWKQLRQYLEKRRYEVFLKRNKGLKLINADNYFYIFRIQWISEGKKKEKPFYGYGHWAEASSYTHFIVAHKGKFFCNELGEWFDNLNYYCKENKAVITSAMEIKNG